MEKPEFRHQQIFDIAPESSVAFSEELIPERRVSSEQNLATSLRPFRSDSRVLIYLALAHTGRETPAEVAEYFTELHTNKEVILNRKTVRKILCEFVTHGLLESQDSVFTVPNASVTPVSNAGLLADVSKKHPTPLRNYFGQAESTGDDSGQFGDTYTHDRIKVLRFLYSSNRRNNPIQPTLLALREMSVTIGISENSAKRHVISLSKGGAFSYASSSSHEGSVQAYKRVTSIPVYKAEEIPSKQTVKDWVKEYSIFNYYRNLTTDDAFSYIYEFNEQVKAMNPSELQNTYEDVKTAIYSLKTRGEITPIHTKAPHFKFEPGSGQLQMMRDIIITLFDMQREEDIVKKRGIESGRAVIHDPFAVNYLLEKVKRERIK